MYNGFTYDMSREEREANRARTLAERINQLRNAAIRGYGHLMTEREHFGGTGLYELASRLSGLLAEAGMVLSQATLGAGDPISRKVMEDLGAKGIVDFITASRTGTVDYHPVTRQVKRWVEARFHETVLHSFGEQLNLITSFGNAHASGPMMGDNVFLLFVFLEEISDVCLKNIGKRF